MKSIYSLHSSECTLNLKKITINYKKQNDNISAKFHRYSNLRSHQKTWTPAIWHNSKLENTFYKPQGFSKLSQKFNIFKFMVRFILLCTALQLKKWKRKREREIEEDVSVFLINRKDKSLRVKILNAWAHYKGHSRYPFPVSFIHSVYSFRRY